MPTWDELARQASDNLADGTGGGEPPSSPPHFGATNDLLTVWARSWTMNDFDGLREFYGHLTNVDQLTRRTREERTTGMNISFKAPEISKAGLEDLTRFYYYVLQRGHAEWPAGRIQAVLWVNGIPRNVKSYRVWHITEDNLYIGHASDSGEGEMSNPITRLAVVTALMSLTGHTNNPELMALVERRFAQITQDNFQVIVAPLGQRPDDRPVEQIAWSADGRLAAQLDGQWVRPLTGEPIAVGEGWVVLDVAEREARPMEMSEVSPEQVTPAQSSVAQDSLRAWAVTTTAESPTPF